MHHVHKHSLISGKIAVLSMYKAPSFVDKLEVGKRAKVKDLFIGWRFSM